MGMVPKITPMATPNIPATAKPTPVSNSDDMVVVVPRGATNSHAATTVPTTTNPSPIPAVDTSRNLPQIDVAKPISASSGKLLEQAQDAYQSRDYEKAIPIYEQFLSSNPNHILALNELGYCYIRFGKYADAHKMLTRALRIDPKFAPANFNISCLYALQGQAESALDYLGTAIQYDSKARQWARLEPDFQYLRKNPRFSALVGN